MKLRRNCFNSLYHALVDAFNRPDELDLVLQLHLGLELEQIVSFKFKFPFQILEIIRWAERTDNVKNLISGARDQNPTNRKLEVAEQLFQNQDCDASSEDPDHETDPWLVKVYEQADSVHYDHERGLAEITITVPIDDLPRTKNQIDNYVGEKVIYAREEDKSIELTLIATLSAINRLFLGIEHQDPELDSLHVEDHNLISPTLSHSDLGEANLSRADLAEVNLQEADLNRADLSKAVLNRANLSGANLYGAILSDADLSRADLSGAILTFAKLSGTHLTGAQYTMLTSWPFGFDPKSAGAKQIDSFGGLDSSSDLDNSWDFHNHS